MAIEKIDITRFIELRQMYPVLDVRSPGEYTHAHIPGAVSLPLFTDEERKVVGTAYKQQGKQQAIKLGLQYFGPKMVSMVEAAETVINNTAPRNGAIIPATPLTVIVHCWRGGMRSAGVAWLLSLYGFKVYTIAGGYKAYRGWVHKQFEIHYYFNVLGGYTGSAKTKLLHLLAAKGRQVIDLEAIANHKGSAFGKIGMPPQPSQEMFENLLAEALKQTSMVKHADGQPPTNNAIWLEDESQRIGDIMLPAALWKNIRNSYVYFLHIPFEERLDFLVKDYAGGQLEEFINAIIRIKKRLGGLEAKTAIHHLMEGEIQEAYRILLTYYDKWYKKGLYNRENVKELLIEIPFDKVLSPGQVAELITKCNNNKKTAP